MKLKYLLLLALAAACIGVFSALFKQSGTREEDIVKLVVKQYLTAWQDIKPEIMYNYLTRTDHESISLAEYRDQFNEFPVRPVKFIIRDAVVLDKTAKVYVTIVWPEAVQGKTTEKKETFYLQCEGDAWKIREDLSLSN